MLVEVHPQMPFGDRRQQISSIIEGIVREASWTQITGIFAYSTAGGLLELLDPIGSLSPVPSLRWLFGLDDCLTEPGAIELAHSVGGVVQVASLISGKRRFHPKVLHFASSVTTTDVAIVGSANLTVNGLTANAEAIAILRAKSAADVASLQNLILSLFSLGHEPTRKELARYRKAYKAARAYHRMVTNLSRRASKAQSGGSGGSATNAAKAASPGLDPTVGTRCWIEVGENTAQGRELEIKAEQALFLACTSRGAFGRQKLSICLTVQRYR